MSFQHLESTRSGGQSKLQPKQRRDEESSFEKSIKANVQQMQECIRRATDQLDSAQRSYLSRRISENLDKALERSRELSQETEQLFRDWTVHLAGEPSERHRKKFSFEKLQRAFEQEVIHLKDVARRAVTTQQDALSSDKPSRSGAIECHPVCGEQEATSCAEDEESGLLGSREAGGQACAQAALQEDTESFQIRSRIAQEREEGIRRIQSQVSEVNQIFRDLATIVQEQGQQMETIESHAEASSGSTRETTSELKKAASRQKSSRERLCWLLAGVVVLLCLVVLPHMHAMQLRHEDHQLQANVASIAVASPAEELPPGFAAAAPGRQWGSDQPPAGPARGAAPASPAGAGTSQPGDEGGRAEPLVISKTGPPLA